GHGEPLDAKVGEMQLGTEDRFWGPEQSHALQDPVDGAEFRIEDPFPADGAQGDGRCPGKNDEHARQPLAAKIAREHDGKNVSEHDDDDLGDDGKDKAVQEGAPELRLLHDAAEIAEADDIEGGIANGGVGQAEGDGEKERYADKA